MYENLSEYERLLAKMGDVVGIIASLEISGKISEEQAFQRIKELYKELKTLRKQERGEWDTSDHDKN